MVLLYHKATHFVDLNPLSYRETNTIQYHPIPSNTIQYQKKVYLRHIYQICPETYNDAIVISSWCSKLVWKGHDLGFQNNQCWTLSPKTWNPESLSGLGRKFTTIHGEIPNGKFLWRTCTKIMINHWNSRYPYFQTEPG